MQYKQCFKCLKSLPITCFYVHKMMADGHLNKCKSCAKSDAAARYARDRDTILEYEKVRNQKPQRKIKRLWRMMLARCHDEKNVGYERYGGRGIYVCSEWRESYEAFKSWATSSGYDGIRDIDRIDNDGPYSPENCRFVSRMENCNNRRNNRFITHLGVRKTVAQWGRDERVPATAKLIYGRLRAGWEPRRALTEPTK